MKDSLLSRLVSVLLPERCVVCAEPTAFDWNAVSPVCGSCLSDLRPLSGELCTACGIPLISEKEICLRCRETEYAFSRNRALFLYEGAAKKLLVQYKIHGEKRISRIFSSFVEEYHQSHFPGIPLVPVPFRPSARRKRGWDQVRVITDRLKRLSKIPVLDCLVRAEGVAQKSLGYERRLRNLKGKVSVKQYVSGIRNMPERVLLFDDVFTTGATLHECARVLKNQGVQEVLTLTLTLDP